MFCISSVHLFIYMLRIDFLNLSLCCAGNARGMLLETTKCSIHGTKFKTLRSEALHKTGSPRVGAEIEWCAPLTTDN